MTDKHCCQSFSDHDHDHSHRHDKDRFQESCACNDHRAHEAAETHKTRHTCCKKKKDETVSDTKSCKHTSREETACSDENNELIRLSLENEQLQEQIKDKEQKYLLSLAEAENSRKRLQKERQELTKYAVENILAEILGPMENLENALGFAKHMSEEVKNWAIGFEMILGQFKSILTDNGVIEYSAVDSTFDPYFHEAVETVETEEYPEGFIIQEFAKGYKVGERPIRVAKVKVAKKPHREEITETDKN